MTDAEAILAFTQRTRANADQAYAALAEKFPEKFGDDKPDEGVTGRAITALELVVQALDENCRHHEELVTMIIQGRLITAAEAMDLMDARRRRALAAAAEKVRDA